MTRDWQQLDLVELVESKPVGPVRVCQQCGQEYVRVKGVTGSKYCGVICQRDANHQGMRRWSQERAAELRKQYVCGACDRHYARTDEGSVANARFGEPLYLCGNCAGNVRHVLNRLRQHRAPATLIYAVARGEHNTCPVCGVNLLTSRKVKNGDFRVPLVVDHDHACCPTIVSKCGKCIRGLMCSRCNSVAGMLGESADLAASLAAYLAARQTTT